MILFFYIDVVAEPCRTQDLLPFANIFFEYFFFVLILRFDYKILHNISDHASRVCILKTLDRIQHILKQLPQQVQVQLLNPYRYFESKSEFEKEN
jgi:hypothetical protein